MNNTTQSIVNFLDEFKTFIETNYSEITLENIEDLLFLACEFHCDRKYNTGEINTKNSDSSDVTIMALNSVHLEKTRAYLQRMIDLIYYSDQEYDKNVIDEKMRNLRDYCTEKHRYIAEHSIFTKYHEYNIAMKNCRLSKCTLVPVDYKLPDDEWHNLRKNPEFNNICDNGIRPLYNIFIYFDELRKKNKDNSLYIDKIYTLQEYLTSKVFPLYPKVHEWKLRDIEFIANLENADSGHQVHNWYEYANSLPVPCYKELGHYWYSVAHIIPMREPAGVLRRFVNVYNENEVDKTNEDYYIIIKKIDGEYHPNGIQMGINIHLDEHEYLPKDMVFSDDVSLDDRINAYNENAKRIVLDYFKTVYPNDYLTRGIK